MEKKIWVKSKTLIMFRLGSPNSTKSTNVIKLEKSLEQAKSEDDKGSMAVPKSKYTRTNTHLRKDVVNKTIIRALCRFYYKHFELNLDYNSNTKELVDSIAHHQANSLITSSISYQECFSLASQEGSKSKLQTL